MTVLERENLINQLVAICRDPDLSQPDPMISTANYDKLPYIPFIPENWNGILVLAESQQLSGNKKGNIDYIKLLNEADEIDQITRLGNKTITEKEPEFKIGITPWDDGYIKLAMTACYPNKNINEFSVSNVIPWYFIRSNKLHRKEYIILSNLYWQKIIPILIDYGLNTIIRTGTYARNILNSKLVNNERLMKSVYYLRSASQLERVAYLFDSNDLKAHYSDINKDINKLKSIQEEEINLDTESHIFYTAHALSKIGSKLKQNES